MDKKLYSSTEQELVSDWADKWFELSYLINKLIWTDDPPWTTPPPTELDELEYQRLRFWFIDHQEQFIPIWEDFYNCKKRVCTEGLIIENVKEFLETGRQALSPMAQAQTMAQGPRG